MVFWIFEIFSAIVVRIFILYCIYRFVWPGYINIILPLRSESQPYEDELIEEERLKPEEDRLKPDFKYTGAGEPDAGDSDSLSPRTETSEQTETTKSRLLRPPVRKYQNFPELLKKSLKDGVLFDDPEFPAETGSVFLTETNKKLKMIKFRRDFGPSVRWQWLRTFEIASTRPQFYPSAGLSHSNIIQGALSNCWLAAAISVVSMYPDLMHQVAPPFQKITRSKYAGIFLFRFWSFGKWIDVVVDDQLPCLNRVPFSIRSKNNDEFLYPLLEKAYAKMYGSYEALEAGFASDAFVDLTGGIAEFYKLKQQQVKVFFTDLLESFQMQSLIACLTKPDRDVAERKLSNGLVAGHAYSVTNVRQIVVERPSLSGKVRRYVEHMIQLRNPYGPMEWNGRWSDGCKDWQWVSDSTKKEIGLKNQDDGEFWMSFQDFVQNFYCVEVVHLTRHVHLLPSTKIPWDFATFHGEWVSGITNGGAAKMAMNPQYRITLTKPDKLVKDGKCIVCIALTQKYRKHTPDLENIAIGFCVYHLPPEYENVAPAPVEFFNGKREPIVLRKSEYIREVSGRYRIPPGPYIIVPFAYYGDEGQFLLRVFSSGHVKMRENDPPLNSPSLSLELDYDAAIDMEVKRYTDLFHRFQAAEIDWEALKIVMDHFGSTVPKFEGFNKEAVRSAIACVDEDRNGKIDYREFIMLFQFLEIIKKAFVEADERKTGTLPPFRFQEIISESGYDLPQAALAKLCLRYSRDDGSFHFDDFILCLIKTHVLSETFEYNQSKAGLVKFNYHEWLAATIFT